MTMRKTIEVISRLAADGAIKEYAIAGAVAALSYIQPFLTEDLDVLVAVAEFDQRPSGLILQSGIESRLAALGYTERSSVGVIVEGWPVQFIPVGSPLDDAALRQATDVELDGFTARFLDQNTGRKGRQFGKAQGSRARRSLSGSGRSRFGGAQTCFDGI